jgi:hypothetical protein
MSSPEENVMAVGATITLAGVDYDLPNIGVGWIAAGKAALKDHRGNPFSSVYDACREKNAQGVIRREMMNAAAAASRVNVTLEEVLEWLQDPTGVAWLIWFGLTKCGGQEVDRQVIEDGVSGLGIEEFQIVTERLLIATGAAAMVAAAKNSPESPEVNLLETESVESLGEPST